ncbi:putative MFS transporter superfamily [Dioscorea sansibarensis]
MCPSVAAIVAVSTAILGYWAAVYCIGSIGRRELQLLGFLFMSVFIFAMAGPNDKYWRDISIAFPARLRSVCHSISGDAGKFGATIGAVGFLWASQDRNREKLYGGWKPGIGLKNSLVPLGGICIPGARRILLLKKQMVYHWK